MYGEEISRHPDRFRTCSFAGPDCRGQGCGAPSRPRAGPAQSDASWTDLEIVAAVDLSRPTVERIRRRFVEEGVDAALDPRRPKTTRALKIDGDVEAHLVALVCGPPPDGHNR